LVIGVDDICCWLWCI